MEQREREEATPQPESEVVFSEVPRPSKGYLRQQAQQQMNPSTAPLPSVFASPDRTREKKAGGGVGKFLTGCCIILLLIAITLFGATAYYTRQLVITLQQKGITDVSKFFQDNFTNPIKQAIEEGIKNQTTGSPSSQTPQIPDINSIQ